MEGEHIPVLVREVIAHFQPKDGDTLLDGTLGLGGHTRAFLEAAGPKSRAIGIDADEKALAKARQRLREFGDRVTYVHANIANLQQALSHIAGSSPVYTHALFDLGIGSHQLADTERGFSFHSSAPLRMKYGNSQLPPAASQPLNHLQLQLGRYPDAEDILLGFSEKDIATLLRLYGEERYAGRIAVAIKQSAAPGTSSRELAEIVAQAVPGHKKERIHPATRTFQALRLAANRELEALSAMLPQAVSMLKAGGRIGVISFHSLEDRIVKQFFRRESTNCICPPKQPVCTCGHKATLSRITKRPVIPSEEEIGQNPRSRSAKLRVAEKQ